MPQPPRRAKSSQPNIPTVSNPATLKLKRKRVIRSPDEAQEEVGQPNIPAVSSPVTIRSKRRTLARPPNKVQEEEISKRPQSFNEDDIRDALDHCFQKLLNSMADIDIGRRSRLTSHPCSFVVYAHENKDAGEANSQYVTEAIKWLREIRAPNLSDVSPLPLWESQCDTNPAVDDILSSQLRLLPAYEGSDRVEKIILYISPVLRKYCENTFTFGYIEQIRKLYEAEKKNIQEFEKEVRKFVKTQLKANGFHHVLTEIAFLDIRRLHYNGGNHGIISITLDGGDLGIEFLTDLSVYIKLHSTAELGDRHDHFFKLLQRLYPSGHRHFSFYHEHYKNLRQWCEEGGHETPIWEKTDIEIQLLLADLRQDQQGEFRDGEWKAHTRNTQNAQYRDCHRAFKTSTYEQFKDFNPDRVEGTCQWALSHPRYLDWYTKAHNDLLWISADPGCGKSVLAKSLVDNELRSTNKHNICYFFFKDNEEQDNIATALCALLHQLFSHQPELIRYAVPAWEKNGDKLQAEVPELWRTLLAAACADEAQDVTCVLDALDECRVSDRRWLIDTLARFYTQISPSSPTTRQGRLKFLVTSRPYYDIQTAFQKTLFDASMIRLRGEDQNDPIHQEIDLVIRMQVGRLAADLELDDDTKNRLETRLLEMKHRTYLWLYLAIESIDQTYRNILRPEEASIALLPSSVEDAYEKILNRVNGQQSSQVKKILQIVVGARRPLHVEEMAIALGIATSVHPKSLYKAKLDSSRLLKNIRQWCGLFVFINHNRIYLIHQTAKEFLVGESSTTTSLCGWKYCLDSREVEREMTQICIEFLSFNDVAATAHSLIHQFKKYTPPDDLFEENNYTQSLLVYSAQHWPSHQRDAHLPHDDPLESRILRFYQVNSSLYNIWFPIFWKITLPYLEPPEMTPIRLGGLLGHENILSSILHRKEDYDINESDRGGRTGLFWASEFGHEKVVQMLLDGGANVNAQEGYHSNALQAASSAGHRNVVKMLLVAGANVNAQGKDGDNALQAASRHGHDRVVQMLLGAGADVNARGFYGNALQAASYHGHEKVVQLLLDERADVNAQGGDHNNALQAASLGGHGNVVKMLLVAGANVNAQGKDGDNALQAACFHGDKEIVQMLLDEGANVNAQGGFDGNALQAACIDGHEQVVKMLLDAGANVNAEGGAHGSALQAACADGNEQVIQILLNTEADVNAQGGEYGSALQAAFLNEHEQVVQMLLAAGATDQ